MKMRMGIDAKGKGLSGVGTVQLHGRNSVPTLRRGDCP